MTTRETELLAANVALEAEIVRLREALRKLACLGNGDSYGNSIGNCIAQEALALPSDTTALNELIEKVERLTIERCVTEIEETADMVRIIGYSYRECLQVAIRALPVGQIKLEELL